MVHPWRKLKDGAGRTVQPVVWLPGPHVHALVWGRVDERKRPAGAYVRALRSMQETVVGTLAYLLDHAGVVIRKHALRWWGVASYNKCPGVPKYSKDKVTPLCPLCGGSMRELGVTEDVYFYWVDLARGLDHYIDGRQAHEVLPAVSEEVL